MCGFPQIERLKFGLSWVSAFIKIEIYLILDLLNMISVSNVTNVTSIVVMLYFSAQARLTVRTCILLLTETLPPRETYRHDPRPEQPY